VTGAELPNFAFGSRRSARPTEMPGQCVRGKHRSGVSPPGSCALARPQRLDVQREGLERCAKAATCGYKPVSDRSVALLQLIRRVIPHLSVDAALIAAAINKLGVSADSEVLLLRSPFYCLRSDNLFVLVIYVQYWYWHIIVTSLICLA